MEGQVEEEEEEDGDGGNEGAGGKKKRFTKEIRTGTYEPCNKDIYTEYRCYKVDIKDLRYNTKRGAPTVFIPNKTECHCGKKCDSDADLALHLTEEHPCNSLWKCYFCNHILHKRITSGSMSEPSTTISTSTFVNLKIVNRAPMAGNMGMMKLHQFGPI